MHRKRPGFFGLKNKVSYFIIKILNLYITLFRESSTSETSRVKLNVD